ncbi:MAG: hypothetical protein IT385_12360 [Deltaproteobacteria bacterium]|nr:hypothetical protein [Deltaproteobacteria bacterium]
MFGPDDDPRDIPDFRSLDRLAIERALAALRHLDQFHTIDVTRHMHVLEAHRERAGSPDFMDLVSRWLAREATRLGLRGPLPGHPSRGERWAWYGYVGAQEDVDARKTKDLMDV